MNRNMTTRNAKTLRRIEPATASFSQRTCSVQAWKVRKAAMAMTEALCVHNQYREARGLLHSERHCGVIVMETTTHITPRCRITWAESGKPWRRRQNDPAVRSKSNYNQA